jgi:hypothetical protein
MIVAPSFRAGASSSRSICWSGSKPCSSTNMLVHCRFGKGAQSWCIYRNSTRAGTMFAAMTERNFGRFCGETLRPDGCSAAYVVRDPPAYLPLDEIEAGKGLLTRR